MESVSTVGFHARLKWSLRLCQNRLDRPELTAAYDNHDLTAKPPMHHFAAASHILVEEFVTLQFESDMPP
jgi:hypothetical protein